MKTKIKQKLKSINAEIEIVLNHNSYKIWLLAGLHHICKPTTWPNSMLPCVKFFLFKFCEIKMKFVMVKNK